MSEEDYLLQIIQEQFRRHQGFEEADLYKLVYQAACGGDHFLKSKVKAKKILQEEWRNLGKIQKGEPLLEMIDPRGEIMRVNLRVYKKIGGNLKDLYEIILMSVQKFQKDEGRLTAYWETIMDLAEKGKVPFSKDVLENFWIYITKKGLPSINHSESYTDINKPSYRVVMKMLWNGFDK